MSTSHDVEFLLRRTASAGSSTDSRRGFHGSKTSLQDHFGSIHVGMGGMSAVCADEQILRDTAQCINVTADGAHLRAVRGRYL